MGNLISNGDEEHKDRDKNARLLESVPNVGFGMRCRISWAALKRVVAPRRIRG